MVKRKMEDDAVVPEKAGVGSPVVGISYNLRVLFNHDSFKSVFCLRPVSPPCFYKLNVDPVSFHLIDSQCFISAVVRIQIHFDHSKRV